MACYRRNNFSTQSASLSLLVISRTTTSVSLNVKFKSPICFTFSLRAVLPSQWEAKQNPCSLMSSMKKSKDPFEIAFEEQEESPPESPVVPHENEPQTSAGPSMNAGGDSDMKANFLPADPSTSAGVPVRTTGPIGKNKEEEEEEEEENMDVELGKLRATGDPAKTAKMQEILGHFTEEHMSRYESFRRSGFQKSNMKRLLTSITGSAKISIPMTIVVSGIAKMFVGELVETARVVMAERRDTGPIRPCHMREAYRRLKLQGKIPKRSVPRLFR